MTWYAGQRLTAARLNGTGVHWAHKATLTDRSSTITPAPDPHLAVDLDPGLWEIETSLYYASLAAPNGIRTVWQIPAGASMVSLRLCMGPASTSTSPSSTRIRAIGLDAGQSATYGSASGVGTPSTLVEAALVRITTPGTVAIAWAQQTSSTSVTRVHAGSWLRAEHVDEEAL